MLQELGKAYLIKLKTILQSNFIYILLIIINILFVYYFTQVKTYQSIYSGNEEKFTGIVEKITVNKDSIKIMITAKEKLTAFYYIKTNQEKLDFQKKVKLGDLVFLEGHLKEPTNNTKPNQFNYKKYLYYHQQFYTLNISSYKVLKKHNSFKYIIKNLINNSVAEDNLANNYIKAFVLGNSSDIDIIEEYRFLGISHLFAVSGMHVSLFVSFFAFVLKRLKINNNISLVIISIFLFFYAFLTNFISSIIRSIAIFLGNRINQLLKLELSNKKVFIICICFITFFKPFIIYDIGFIFSSIISGYLIFFSDLISQKKNYFSRLFLTSLIAWIVSFPIVVYNYYEINFLSVIYNMFFVPVISFIMFPLSILALIITPLKSILIILVTLMEKIIIFLANLKTSLIFIRPNYLVLIIYFIVITFVLYFVKCGRYSFIFLFLFLIIIHYNYNLLLPSSYLIALDVGQGDCFLLHNYNKTFMIDTGGDIFSNGNYNFSKKAEELLATLKSLGIRKINYLFITHGDYDHMGEAINLVNNFKVEKVIFNCGENNDLEKELIKVLDKKKIKYYSCIKELNIDENKLYFLQTKEYDNENDNSNVIYTELSGYKFMFMGDASISTEHEILNKYNLSDIDVLKVGHHGSKTSSSKDFINEINPKYSIISVGKNNRYGHPNKEVLNNLENSKIYRTDKDGSIMFKVKNNKLKIETCSP